MGIYIYNDKYGFPFLVIQNKFVYSNLGFACCPVLLFIVGIRFIYGLGFRVQIKVKFEGSTLGIRKARCR